MKDTKTLRGLLIFSGIGIIGYALYRYYKKQVEFIQNYQYKVTGLKIVSIKPDEITVDITTKITNDSNVDATIKEMYLDFYVNKSRVGNINEVKDIQVRANATSDFSFRISFNPKLVLGNLVNIVTLSVGAKDLIFDVEGYVKVESGLVKTTIPFTYSNNLKSILK
jgi:LEA14-like dessication related protein